MGCVLDVNQRRLHGRDLDRFLFHRFGRPEIQDPRLAIEEPFAERIQLFEDVEEKEPSAVGAGPETVIPVGRAGLDQAGLGVDGGDVLVGVGPVIGPVAVNPDVGGVGPLGGAVRIVVESRFEFTHGSSVLIPE